jgi:hypothetical protein
MLCISIIALSFLAYITHYIWFNDDVNEHMMLSFTNKASNTVFTLPVSSVFAAQQFVNTLNVHTVMQIVVTVNGEVTHVMDTHGFIVEAKLCQRSTSIDQMIQ